MRAPIAVAVLVISASVQCGLVESTVLHHELTSTAALPTVTLTVTQPPGPFTHHTTVSVAWNVTSGDFDPQLDWLSSWWEPFPATYVEYVNVTGNTGTATFTLLNARYPYSFRYYRGNTTVFEAWDRAIPDATTPMGVRVVLQGTDANEVTVMWTSNRSLGGDTVVEYGFAADALTFTQSIDKSLTYSAAEINERLQLPPIERRTLPFDNIGSRALRCGWGTCYNDFTANEMWVDPGLQHVATLRNLAPDTVYFYRVGERGGRMSVVRRFRSKAEPSPNSSISVIYVADAGAGYTTGGYSGSASHNDCPIPPVYSTDGARHVWDAIKADPKMADDTMSVMNGDISYARGWPLIWELFHNETEDIFGVLPVAISIGNHEMDYGQNPFALANGGDSGGECGIATGRRFNIDERRPWFYFANGPAFFVSLSTEHDPVRQAQWLELEVMPKFDRRVTPWLIVFLHRPLYSSNRYDDEAPLHLLLLSTYGNVFVKLGVDVVLTGHAHYYERSCEVSSGTCNTWGFRDVWTEYHDIALDTAKAGACVLPAIETDDIYACHAQCARSQAPNATSLGNCTGVQYNATSKACVLFACAQPFPLTYTYGASIWSMQKESGRAPVYILDGTAGGVFTPDSTPFAETTRYKDFDKWGYSRMQINGSTLVWRHHHVDGSVVDHVELAARAGAN